MKVDVMVDDGLNVISRTSYVFPSRLLEVRSTNLFGCIEQLGAISGNYTEDNKG